MGWRHCAPGAAPDRTLYNVNTKDAEEFLQLAGETDLGIGTEVYPLGECQDAMIRLRRGETKQPNVVIRVEADLGSGATVR